MRFQFVIILLAAFLFTLADLEAQDAIHDPTVKSGRGGGTVQAGTSAEFQNMLRLWIEDSVHGDFRKGRGPAGLIAYLTDHLQAEQKGEGWQYRKNILLDSQNYLVAEKELPLGECVDGIDAVSETLCIAKGTMLFHMLRGITGEEFFYHALRKIIQENKYKLTSWADIRAAFEHASGKNLEWFFSQWVDRKGMPDFEIRDERVTIVNGVQTVSFDILQEGEAYRFKLPVAIRTDRGEVFQTLDIDKEKEHFDIPVNGSPIEIVADGGYDLMRKLSREESPPLLSGLLGDAGRLLIIPDEDIEKYSDFINALKQTGFSSREESEITDEDIRAHSMLILGYKGRVVKRLFGNISTLPSGFSLSTRKNPLNPAKVIAIAYADARENIPSHVAVLQSARYSHVRFMRGDNVEKKTENAARGMVVNLDIPALTIQPAKLPRLEDAFSKIFSKTVIYAGERHMNYEDHKAQLKLIMNLHERGHVFAIGMEMFQRPFQKDIDNYLAGVLSEKEFLKKTQYFKRWQFDYNLYREIIEYAKAMKIPIIALNIWTEIVKKVSADGLDSLTDIERTELPDSMDMSDEDYRRRLEDVFRQHKSHENKNFDNFYQAQILWDEIMAKSIDEFLRKNPGHQMLVLAGAGHIMYGSGIPKRAHRLNKKDYVILLPAGDFIDSDVGDYLISTEPLAPPTTLKLGVILKEREGYVEVEKVVPGSIAKSAGLEKGDILLSINDWKIEEIDDVHIFMFDKKRGEQVTIKVLRKKFLAGYREVVLKGTI